jgi:hypothetical protein
VRWALGLALVTAACVQPGHRRHLGWTSWAVEAESRCQAGGIAACGELGRYLVARSPSDRGDLDRGLVLLEVACGGDDQRSCARLGEMYSQDDSPSSRARGHDLLDRSCAAGGAQSCTVLLRLARGQAEQAATNANVGQPGAVDAGTPPSDASAPPSDDPPR